MSWTPLGMEGAPQEGSCEHVREGQEEGWFWRSEDSRTLHRGTGGTSLQPRLRNVLCPHVPSVQVEGSLRPCRWWAGLGRVRCWAVTCCLRLAGPPCTSSSGCALDSCSPSSSSLASTLPESTLVLQVRLVLRWELGGCTNIGGLGRVGTRPLLNCSVPAILISSSMASPLLNKCGFAPKQR